jgi:hypothetical protein
MMMPHLWGYLRINNTPRTGPADLESLSTLKDGREETIDEIDIEKEFEE